MMQSVRKMGVQRDRIPPILKRNAVDRLSCMRWEDDGGSVIGLSPASAPVKHTAVIVRPRFDLLPVKAD